MEVGVEVWVKDATTGDWSAAVVASKILSDDGSSYEVSMTCEYIDEPVVVTLKAGDTTIESTSVDMHDEVKLRNDAHDKHVQNLINLPYLHEPAILYCLEQRYNQSNIYTYTGPILIAVNPFKKVPLYTTQILETYYNQGLLTSQGIESPTVLDPHIYAISDAAFRDMMTAISSERSHKARAKGAGAGAGKHNADQAILVSGESGAGKTESTKIVLKYLTTVGNSSGGMETTEGSVMDKVLQSNPILEAFGNAKTIRNDNSSRFGKFIELNFSKRGHLVGGTIRTYLLEKVRLPTQQPGERNFHVFYQMFSGAKAADIDHWHIGNVENYRYTNQGGVYKLAHIDDAEEYNDLRKALKTLNFQSNDVTSLFDAMAGILHLGQVELVPDEEGEGSRPAPKPETAAAIEHSCEMLGIEPEVLLATFTTRTLVTGGESVIKKMPVSSAYATRDALAKAIYGRIFDWIVTTINYSIHVDPSTVRADIGVLDIFGFECFVLNSFEQLCINYTNETLQQQFNQYVFKLEQIEYDKEKIEWSFISFPDNQDCLDLIEHKTQGIFAYLDDEGRLPKASDEKLANRLYKALESHPRFSSSPKQRRDMQFSIQHYAGPVIYTVTSFIEKNKDELPKEAVSLMQQSKTTLLSAVFIVDLMGSDGKPAAAGASPAAAAAIKAGPQRRTSIVGDNVVKSVGSQFKSQLASLMEKILSTKPHYIRCLKPNDQNVPDSFNRLRTTEQLRYGGVLEAVRVARSGFPVRLTHEDFYARYRCLANPLHSGTKNLPTRFHKGEASSSSIISNDEAKRFADSLLDILWDSSKAAADPALAPSETSVSPPTPPADASSSSSRKQAALLSWTGPHSVSKSSVQLGLTKTFLRNDAHGLLEGRRSRRCQLAVTSIQSFSRGLRLRKHFLSKLYSLLLLQRVMRGMFARKRARAVRQNRAACKMQSQFRMFIARYKYTCLLYSVVTLQSLRRKMAAKKRFNSLVLLKRVLRVQRFARGMTACYQYRKYRRAVTTLQNKHRSRRAKEELRLLRQSAKDLGAVQLSNAALKKEIELLREQAHIASEERARKAEQQAEERAAAAAQVAREQERAEYIAKVKILEDERANEADTLIQTKSELQRIKAELAAVSNHQPQSNADAHLAEISMLQDLLSSERDNRSQVERDLMEAMALLSQERKDRLKLEAELAAAFKQLGTPQSDLNKTWHEVTTPEPGAAAVELSSITSPAFESPLSGAGSNRSIISVSGVFGVVEAAAASSDARALRHASSTSIPDDEDDEEDENDNGRSSMYIGDPDSPLNNERSIRMCLEDEVRRLRKLTSELGNELESMKTNPQLVRTNSSGSGSGSASSGNRPRRYSNPRTGSNPSSPSTSSSSNIGSIEDMESKEASVSAGMSRNRSTSGSESTFSPSRRPSSGMDSTTAANTAANRARTASAELIAEQESEEIKKFYKSLDTFHAILQAGVMVNIWEGNDLTHKIEVKMQLDAACQQIKFNEPKSRKKTILPAAAAAWFAPKIAIAPIRVDDIFECLPGGDSSILQQFPIQERVSTEAALMTLVSRSESHRPRTLLILLADKEKRNFVMSGVRMMQSAQSTMRFLHHVRSPASTAPVLAGVPSQVSSSNSDVAGDADRLSVDGSVANGASSPSRPRTMSATRRGSWDAPIPVTTTSGASGSATSSAQSNNSPVPAAGARANPHATRRLNKREEILTNASRRPSGTSANSNSTAQAASPMPTNSANDNRNMAASPALSGQVIDLVAYERSLSKNLQLTNELNDRENEIAQLKRREAVYEQTLKAKEKMYEQDANVRMQLGRRLEQILLDKEEAKDEIDDLKAHVQKLESILMDHAQEKAEREAEQREQREQRAQEKNEQTS